MDIGRNTPGPKAFDLVTKRKLTFMADDEMASVAKQIVYRRSALSDIASDWSSNRHIIRLVAGQVLLGD